MENQKKCALGPRDANRVRLELRHFLPDLEIFAVMQIVTYKFGAVQFLIFSCRLEIYPELILT